MLIMVGFGSIKISNCVLIFYGGKFALTNSSRFVLFRFNNLRVPRENLLNSVADVLPDGQYVSAIKNPDQVVTCVHSSLSWILYHYSD